MKQRETASHRNPDPRAAVCVAVRAMAAGLIGALLLHPLAATTAMAAQPPSDPQTALTNRIPVAVPADAEPDSPPLLLSATTSYFFETLEDDQGAYVTLTGATVETIQEGDYYKSTVHLTLQNKGHTEQELLDDPYLEYWSPYDDQQYTTSFPLPDGVFVTNYYLDIAGTRKYGLLAERNSALWIYNQVVSRAMDPGLLYYDGKQLTLRVFPFAPGETRYTGIEFLHREPVTLRIDGQTVSLAPQAPVLTQPKSIGARAIYLSAASKEGLPAGQRKPHYVFVADCSENARVEEIANQIRSFCTDNNIVRDTATIYATNDSYKAIPMTDPNWNHLLVIQRREGRFDFGATVDAILRAHNTADTYPVIIAVRSKNTYYGWSLPATNLSLAQRVPEMDGYFMLTGAYMRQYIFDSRNSFPIDRLPRPNKTVTAEIGGQTFWVRDDGQPEILVRDTAASRQTAAQGEWENAVDMMAGYRRLGMRSAGQRPAAQLSLVKRSFASRVMLPVTSFITLETEEQETRMLNYQKKLLGSGDIEKENSERSSDSMFDYDEVEEEADDVDDDDFDEEPPDDEDGYNPATGGLPATTAALLYLLPLLLIGIAVWAYCLQLHRATER